MSSFIEEIKAYKVGDNIFSIESEAEEYLNDLEVEVTFEGMGDWEYLKIIILAL